VPVPEGGAPRRARLGAGLGSLRFRIALIATAGVLVVLAGGGLTLVSLHRSALTHNLDEGMRQRADQLADLVADGAVPTVLLGGADDDAIAQIVGADGEVVGASPTVAGDGPLIPPGTTIRDGRIRGARFPSVDDTAFRFLSVRRTGPDGEVVIHVAETLDDIDDSTGALAASLGAVVPVAALVLGFIIWWGVGRALRPVEAIRAEVAAIGGAERGRRVPEPARRDEIGRLAATMNAMLGRIDEAAERQQRFVADASHELRSPLTQIRSEIEVDLAHPERADLVATHRTVLGSATSMQRLVDDLLHLAKGDARVAGRRDEPVDLDEVVLELARRHRTTEVELDTSRVSSGQVNGDPEALARAVTNLVDNALRHASATVLVTLEEHDGEVVLTVTDDGPGIPEAERERVFERFVRLDSSRARATGGTGLGLAIAREIVEDHGGRLELVDHEGAGARFAITLPASTGGTAPGSLP